MTTYGDHGIDPIDEDLPRNYCGECERHADIWFHHHVDCSQFAEGAEERDGDVEALKEWYRPRDEPEKDDE